MLQASVLGPLLLTTSLGLRLTVAASVLEGVLLSTSLSAVVELISLAYVENLAEDSSSSLMLLLVDNFTELWLGVNRISVFTTLVVNRLVCVAVGKRKI